MRIKLRESWLHPLVLLGVAVLAYGVLIPWLGYYWDDWQKAWSLHALGPQGFHEVFARDRPILAWTYLITTRILGETPIPWQVFGLATRWLSAVSVWWLLKQVWPSRKTIAVLTSFIFLVFPGFSQQSISLIYSHYFLIQTVHIFALGFMVLAIRQPERRIMWTILSLAGSAYSIFSFEYFVGWELLRPLLIYWVVKEEVHPLRQRLRKTLRFWLPYLPLLPLYIGWRIQVVGYSSYEPGLLDRFINTPLLGSVEHVLRLLLHDLIEVTVGSWIRIIPFPDPQAFGVMSTVLLAFVVTAVIVLVGAYLYRRADELSPRFEQSSRDIGAVLVTGIYAILIAGWPFWITELPLKPYFPNDRFVLSFTLGGSMIIVALIMALGFAYRARIVGVAIIAVLIGLAAGQQVRYATDYRRERDIESNLLWQFIWRVPDLEPGTAVLINEIPLKYDDDESISGAVNWIFGNEEMPYLVADLRLRLGRAFASLEEDQPIHKDYRAMAFDGTTSQVVVMSFDPPRCLRVYDVVLHDSLPGIPSPLPSAIPLSDLDLILPVPTREISIPTGVLGPEPPHRWCYYFQQADLALQRQDWEQIAKLGDIAFELGDRPNDASERLPFVEGYAHVGRWEDAMRLSLEIVAEQPAMRVIVCRTWQRLEDLEPVENRQEQVYDEIYSALSCREL